MKQRLIKRWQAWMEVWSAIHTCHVGRNQKLEVRRTGLIYDAVAGQHRERLEFHAADNAGWRSYQRSRNLLAVRVPRLERLLSKLKWI